MGMNREINPLGLKFCGFPIYLEENLISQATFFPLMKRVYLVDYGKCTPHTCGRPCVTKCPITLSNLRKKPHEPKGEVPIRYKKSTRQMIIKSEFCLSCGVCVNVCPMGAIFVKSLVEEPDDETPTHQYFSTNQVAGFRIFNLPTLVPGRVSGLCGPNGIGKSTVLEILAGYIRPNFGHPPASKTRISWAEIIPRFRDNEMRDHFSEIARGTRKIAYKRQVLKVLFENYHEQPVETILRAECEVDDTFFRQVTRALDIHAIATRTLHQCSGGELQRFAIASILVREADVYLIDEPCTFLDVKKRIQLARLLRDRASGFGGIQPECPVLVVEHDLAVLDYMSDVIHLFYGEPHKFGVVSRVLSTKKGINAYLDGYLKAENIQFREESKQIRFKRSAGGRTWSTAMVLADYGAIKKHFDSFQVGIEPGRVYNSEILGIMGENGCGKSTFAKILAREISPDENSEFKGMAATISYKPQYITRDSELTVKEFITRRSKNYDFSPEYVRLLYGPLGVDKLFDTRVENLSGGELQRVFICACLAKRADVYLLDEPSAYLDVEERLHIGQVIRTIAKRTNSTAICIEHDLQIADALVDRVMLFSGQPGIHGHGSSPYPKREGMNAFLQILDITFRRDPTTGRARINKKDSRLDQIQRATGEWWGVKD